eukprot:TRINITY_DN2747_c0_g1_i1.p2 TRINITY_DN2747_c0_g1~~TRINITY_DN2747_c0_g1_i1.p2  ORF type:complete len:122 (-),score=15.36 TRINITY_DN2747_c0_g1_i1:631-996(-)
MAETLQAAAVPTDFGRSLRACLRCSLVKTFEQFLEAGCENCDFFVMERDKDRVLECTTHNFSGVIALMHPDASWVARYQRIGKFVPGCYAVHVAEPMSEELQTLCEDRGKKYIPRHTLNTA